MRIHKKEPFGEVETGPKEKLLTRVLQQDGKPLVGTIEHTSDAQGRKEDGKGSDMTHKGDVSLPDTGETTVYKRKLYVPVVLGVPHEIQPVPLDLLTDTGTVLGLRGVEGQWNDTGIVPPDNEDTIRTSQWRSDIPV